MQSLLSNCYSKIAPINSGTYGDIYLYKKVKEGYPKNSLARMLEPGKKKSTSTQYFALKRFKSMPQEKNCGIHFSALGQIKLLSSLNHPYIVRVLQVLNKELQIFMVMDYLIQLQDVIRHPLFAEAQRRHVIKMILQALNYLDQNFILHRDLKPQNVLMNSKGQVKLVDFGFARRASSPKRQLTFKVCTRQFRAPQIDMGSSFYTSKVDIWSAGCVLAYLYLGKSIFQVKQGQNDIDFLAQVFQVCGVADQQSWPNCTKLPRYKEYSKTPRRRLKDIFQGIPQDAENIITHMLEIDPNRRPSAAQCLQHDYFKGLTDSRLEQICTKISQESLQKLINQS